jgi:hypothetical protein
MIEYRAAIVDELGYVVYWCSELPKEEIAMILDKHPEWRIQGIEV